MDIAKYRVTLDRALSSLSELIGALDYCEREGKSPTRSLVSQARSIERSVLSARDGVDYIASEWAEHRSTLETLGLRLEARRIQEEERRKG